MRADGATYADIREALGIGSSTTVSRILGIAGTGRSPGPRRQIGPELRERARALRHDGRSVPEISRALGIARSSAWSITKDIAWTPGPTPSARRAGAGRRYWEQRHKQRSVDRAIVRGAARVEVGELSDRIRVGALKRHNPKTRRQNRGDGYHGCLAVRVNRSTREYWRMDGLWAGIAEQVRRPP